MSSAVHSKAPDRRRWTRQLVQLSGALLLQRGSALAEVCVEDLSDYGARLRVKEESAHALEACLEVGKAVRLLLIPAASLYRVLALSAVIRNVVREPAGAVWVGLELSHRIPR